MNSIDVLRRKLPPVADRHWPILVGTVRGLTLKEIAAQTNLCVKSIAAYRYSLYKQFGVLSAVGLVHACYAADAIKFLDKPDN